MLLRGPRGVGKTTLAQHLGLAALAKGHTMRFSTLSTAMADLLKQESVLATERRLKRYVLPELPVLDSCGVPRYVERSRRVLSDNYIGSPALRVWKTLRATKRCASGVLAQPAATP
ncbi:MAG: ATP-binding protein [Polyangiales bacterium]